MIERGGGVYGDMGGVFLGSGASFSGEEVYLAMFISSGKKGASERIEEGYS